MWDPLTIKYWTIFTFKPSVSSSASKCFPIQPESFFVVSQSFNHLSTTEEEVHIRLLVGHESDKTTCGWGLLVPRRRGRWHSIGASSKLYWTKLDRRDVQTQRLSFRKEPLWHQWYGCWFPCFYINYYFRLYFKAGARMSARGGLVFVSVASVPVMRGSLASKEATTTSITTPDDYSHCLLRASSTVGRNSIKMKLNYSLDNPSRFPKRSSSSWRWQRLPKERPNRHCALHWHGNCFVLICTH